MATKRLFRIKNLECAESGHPVFLGNLRPSSFSSSFPSSFLVSFRLLFAVLRKNGPFSS